MDIWTKALRGGGPSNASTPRAKSYSNNRYSSNSKGGAEEEVVDSADSGQKSQKERTPRQAGMYDRPWKDLASLSSAGRGTPRSRAYAARPPVPRQNSNVDDGDAASVAESDDISVTTEDDFIQGGQEGESVQVFVRVRPINGAEAAEVEHYNCTRIYGDRTVSVELKHRSEPYQFKFDCVLPENTTQQEIFDRAGKPIVDNCMGGYNSTIFAYGQTGAGKTYTMQGPLTTAQEGSDERGLAPRVFEYLFSEIDRAQDEQCHENLTFCCRCSMLEIYNEVITDLLNPSATNLQIREDIKRGCYVEDLSEQLIQNVSDAMRLMRTGAENRHVGETRLNRESSRSHSVFTCTLERHSKSEETGVTNVLFSRLNLIDLAGSERIHGGEHGGSQATGKHFKEACHINKSLTTLGRVIMELVEAQRTGSGRGLSGGGLTSKMSNGGAKTRHVPYRDSRLTFLLQDSLGGNAKTLMIANISPSSVSAQETLSTLQFMSRAKCIRNRATINLDARGDVVLLQREIVRLNTELDNLRKGYTEPAIQENKDLRLRLEEMCTAKGQMEALMLGLEKENQNLKAERRRLDHKMSQIQKGAGQLDQAIFSLTAKVMHHESLAAAATEKSLAAAKAEHDLQIAEMQLALAEKAQGAEQLNTLVTSLQEELHQERTGRKETELRLQNELRDSVAAAADKVQMMQKELQNVHATVEDLKAENVQLSEQLADTKANADQEAQKQLEAAAADKAAMQQQLDEAAASNSAMQQQLEEAEAARASLQQQLDETAEARDEACEALDVAKAVNAGLDDQVKQLMAQIAQAESKLSNRADELAASSSSLSETQQKLESTQAELLAVQQQLASEQEAATQQAADWEAERQRLQQQLEEMGQQLQQASDQNDEANQQISDLTSKAATLQQQVQELEARNSSTCSSNSELQEQLNTAQQQLAEVQKQLEDAAAASTANKAAHETQVQQLQQELEAEQGKTEEGRAQVAALEDVLSELNTTLKEKSQALEGAQEQCKQLQQQLESTTAAATAKADQLTHDLAAARESSKSRQEELMKQVTEVHLQLSAAQQEQERLQDELDASRSDNSLLQARLVDAEGQIDKLRGQASSKGLDCDLLRKKLSAADTTVSNLKAELGERGAELDEMRQQLQAAEATAREEQEKAAEQLNSLQRELMDTQEMLTSRGFEVQQLQRRLEELANRLSDRNSALEAQKEEVKGLKSTLANMEKVARQRDGLLADKTALADQLQADNEALHTRVHKLQEDLASKENQLRCKLNANELQLKEQIVYNARNRQAMNEIRKVINWAQQAPTLTAATTPTGSAVERPSSGGGHHPHQAQRQQQLPFSAANAGSELPLPAEEHFVDEGFGAPSAAYAGSNSSSSSHGSSRSGGGSSSSGGQLAPGLPGPPGPECLPLMLEEVEIGMPSSMLGRCSTSGGGADAVAARPGGDGDGMMSSSLGAGGAKAAAAAGKGSGHAAGLSGSVRQSKVRVPEVDVHCLDVDTQEAQEGQHLYMDESRGELGSDCSSRQLLVPEQASSPVRLSSEDSLQHLASPQRTRGSMSRNSRRGGDRDASRRGLRMGSDHHNFSANKRQHNVLMSNDGNVVLSMSAEWSAGGNGGHDMQLPAAIVGGEFEHDA